MYGVDQCRMCGKPIVVRTPTAREAQEDAIRKPVVPEKVWRARGYLTPPTSIQWYVNPADGCCFECARTQLNRKMRPELRLIALASLVLIGLGSVLTAIVFMRH